MNKVLLVSVVAWAVAQAMKTIVVLIRRKRLDFSYFVNGGMPSSHSATVSALAASVGIVEGFGSSEFGITAILAMVVMYDAASVRRWVGRQSRVLNRITRELSSNRPLANWEQDLREFVGHTPVEVIVGSLLGIFIAWIWFTITT